MRSSPFWLIAGFGMKLGMVPFSGWMPLNYAASPIPVAAVLSGAGVKAGVIGLIRFPAARSRDPVHRAGARRVRICFRILRRGARPDTAKRQEHPRLFQHQPDGVITAALGMAQISGASAAADAGFYGVITCWSKRRCSRRSARSPHEPSRSSGWTMALTAAPPEPGRDCRSPAARSPSSQRKHNFETAWVSEPGVALPDRRQWLADDALPAATAIDIARRVSIETPRS